MFHVDFLNKNTFRNYPLRGDSPVVTEAGLLLPTDVLSAARFTVTATYGLVYISRLYIVGDYLNILIGSLIGGHLTYLGFFDGVVTTDYQILRMSSLVPSAYGTMVLGKKASLVNFQGYHSFTSTTGRIEDSLVTWITPPVLTSVIHGDKTLTGNIALQFNNVRQVMNTTDLQLEVISKEAVKAVNDTSSKYLNCPTNPIGSINNVQPDENGNIDIYGISPVVINVNRANASISLTVPTIGRDELCGEPKQIPPNNPVTTYGNIKQVAAPEWQSWPHYSAN